MIISIHLLEVCTYIFLSLYRPVLKLIYFKYIYHIYIYIYIYIYLLLCNYDTENNLIGLETPFVIFNLILVLYNYMQTLPFHRISVSFKIFLFNFIHFFNLEIINIDLRHTIFVFQLHFLQLSES